MCDEGPWRKGLVWKVEVCSSGVLAGAGGLGGVVLDAFDAEHHSTKNYVCVL
jgi:hypothetical protein